jgi:hypothetical protein
MYAPLSPALFQYRITLLSIYINETGATVDWSLWNVAFLLIDKYITVDIN